MEVDVRSKFKLLLSKLRLRSARVRSIPCASGVYWDLSQSVGQEPSQTQSCQSQSADYVVVRALSWTVVEDIFNKNYRGDRAEGSWNNGTVSKTVLPLRVESGSLVREEWVSSQLPRKKRHLDPQPKEGAPLFCLLLTAFFFILPFSMKDYVQLRSN